METTKFFKRLVYATATILFYAFAVSAVAGAVTVTGLIIYQDLFL
jgi:hypothetical protein